MQRLLVDAAAGDDLARHWLAFVSLEDLKAFSTVNRRTAQSALRLDVVTRGVWCLPYPAQWRDAADAARQPTLCLPAFDWDQYVCGTYLHTMDPQMRSRITNVAVPRSAMLRAMLRQLPGVTSVRTWQFYGDVAGIKYLSALKRRHMYKLQREIDIRSLTYTIDDRTKHQESSATSPEPLPLQKLTLHNASIVNLNYISSLRGLTSLDLALADIDRENSAFKCLESLTQLQSLNLDRTGLSDLSFLQTLSQLHTLSIAGAAVGSLDALEAVGATLTSLDVSNVWLEHERVDLSALSKLRELRANLLGAMGPLHIQLQAPELEMCSLRNCWLEHSDFFAQCPRLSRLDLRDTILFDTASQSVALPQLRMLQVSSNPAAIRSFDWTQALQLETLRLQKWSPAFVDGERIDGLFLAKLPRLHTLEIAKLSKYNASLQAPFHLVSLTIQQLKVSHVEALNQLVTSSNKLETLCLSAEAAVRLKLPFLRAPQTMRELRLVNVTVTNLDVLERCGQLRALAISGFGTIADTATLRRLLRKCTHLRSLKLTQNTALDDLTLLAVLPQLELLSVRHTGVHSIAPVASLRELRELDAGFTHAVDFSPAGQLTRLTRVVLPSSAESCALFHDADAFPMLRSVVHEHVECTWDCLRCGHDAILAA